MGRGDGLSPLHCDFKALGWRRSCISTGDNMFAFLKNIASKAGAKPETQRQTVERALAEINAIVGTLEAKPKLVFDAEAGVLELELPAQMPDETLALPAPEDVAEPEADTAPEAETAEKP